MRKRRESVTSIVTFQNNRFLKYIENKPNRTRHFRFHFNLKDSNYENIKINPESFKYNNNKDNDLYSSKYKAKIKSKENNEKIKKKENQKKKLETIDLLEKNTKNINDWNILLNYPNKCICNNKKEFKFLEEKSFGNEPNDNLPEFPVVLVDLNDNQIKKFFGERALISGRNKNSLSAKKNSPKFTLNSLSTEDSKRNKNSQKRFLTDSSKNMDLSKKNSYSHNIRPVSMYSNRNPEETFYFSNAFSDYYNEDLKSFSEKMPILKPKVKTSNKRLKKELIKQRIKSLMEEKILNNIYEKDNLKLKKQDLIIAGDRKNAKPLLKSIFYQQNPELEIEEKKKVKNYYKTMKPYGNKEGNIDYTKNERWNPSKEIKNLREQSKNKKQYNSVGTSMDNSDFMNNKNGNHFKKKNKLILSYYDKDDPDIKFFDYLIKKYNNKIYNIHNTDNNDSDNDIVKENLFLSNFKNKKVNTNIKTEYINKKISKFPIVLEQYKKYNKTSVENNKEEK